MAILFRRLWCGASAEVPAGLRELFIDSYHLVKSSSKNVPKASGRNCLNICCGSLKATGCLLFSHLFPAHHSPKFAISLWSGEETKTGKMSKAGQGREQQRQRGSKRKERVDKKCAAFDSISA